MSDMNDVPDMPTYSVPRLAALLTIDGDLNKPSWQSLQPHLLHPTSGLAEGLQEAGYPPTTLRLAWTATHLYLAFHCVDNYIWGTETERDAPLYEEEVVEVFLCPTGDLRRYYELEVSPRNVVFDATVHSPDFQRATMKVDTGWDCPGLETAVQIEGVLLTHPPSLEDRNEQLSCWNVEIAIPFAAFPEVPAPQPGTLWRANFYRIDRPASPDPPAFLAWSRTLEVPANFHVPNRFGTLRFEG